MWININDAFLNLDLVRIIELREDKINFEFGKDDSYGIRAIDSKDIQKLAAYLSTELGCDFTIDIE